MKVALLTLAVAAAALVAATHASARQLCTPSSSSSSRTFCGPAKATLKVGGKTYHFAGGSCGVSGSYWAINIGTITLKGKPKHTYFGITVHGKKPGTYTNAPAISWQFPGKSSSLLYATVTIAKDMQSGTFSGSVIPGSGKGSGSFSCK